jgi:hypothetical protein
MCRARRSRAGRANGAAAAGRRPAGGAGGASAACAARALRVDDHGQGQDCYCRHRGRNGCSGHRIPSVCHLTTAQDAGSRNDFRHRRFDRHLLRDKCQDKDLRKLIEFDEDTFAKLKQLGRDRMATIQELADEAFADMLKKHGIPIDLKDALRKSARGANAAPTGKTGKSSSSKKKL